MKLPENFKPTLERLVSQLHDLLPEEARPRGSIPTDTSSASSGTTSSNTFTLISEEQMSNDEEIHRVQRFYNMAWLALNEVLPGIESIDSENQLKEHLFQKKRAILQQWSHISLDRIRRDISEPNYAPTTTAQLIPQDHLVKIAGKEEEKVSELLQENAVKENTTEKEVAEERTAKEKAAKEKAEQEEKDLHALFMQLSYNILHISAVEIPQQTVFKSPEELGWHSLNESQRIVDQLKFPLLNYLCRFLPNTDKPLTMGEMITDGKLSTDLEIQFFQRLYNIICLLSNTIFPSLQGEGKCHSANDVISNLVSPIVDAAVHGQMTSFLDQSLHYFINELYKLLPAEGRPETVGEIVDTKQIKENPFKGNNDLQVIVSIYNVACQIKNSILPRIKGIDSASISGLVTLFSEGFSLKNLVSFLANAKKIADFLDEIKPLLKNLKPIFNQMRIFFINDLHARLKNKNKPSKCGELIADDKFSTTDPTIFFTQKCYNLACFILNEIIPGMEKCRTATGSLIFLFEDEQAKNFEKHFDFINDLRTSGSVKLPIASAETTDSTQTTKTTNSSEVTIPLQITKDQSLTLSMGIVASFLEQMEKFITKIPHIVNNFIAFFKFLVKETVKFTNLSITLNNTLSAPLVSGNLSYYAACHINEATETLRHLLSEGSHIEYKEGDPRLKESQNHLLIQSHLINLDQFMSTFFGFSKKTNAFDPGIEKTLGEFGILSVKPEKTANFVAKEVKEISPEYHELYNKKVSLNEKVTNFSAYLLTPQNCENTDVTEMFQDIQKQYHDFNQAIQVFSNHLDLLPKTKFIDFYVDSGGTINKQDHNYSDLAELVPYCKKSSEKFDEAIKNKIKILDQLKENNAYIKKAYENLSTSVINPAQDLLEKEKPTSYQFDYHQKINALLLNLKKESFSEPKIDDLPHKEISKDEYVIKIDMFHRNFHTKRQTLITELAKEFVNQKAHFNELLKNEVTQKLSDLSAEIKVNTNILTDLFEKIGEDSGETNYRETLKSIEDWLATMTMDSLVSEILKTKSLENTELVNPWVSEFSGSDVGKEFVTQIKTLTTPLIQLIENQRVQLNATNQKEIEQLQGEINALATKITTYSESSPKVLEEIKVLQEKQQQEKQNLWEQHEKPNEIVQGLVQKVNAYTKTLNLSPISANTNVDLSSEIDGLFEALQKKLTSLAIDIPSLKSPPPSPSSKLSALNQLGPSSTSSTTSSSSSSSSASSESDASISNTTSSSSTFAPPNSPPPTSPTNRPKKSPKEMIEKLNDRATKAEDFENILKILKAMKDEDVDKKSISELEQAIQQLANLEKNSDEYLKVYALNFAKKLVVATAQLETFSAQEQSLISDRETIKEKTQEACTVLGGILGDLTETISQQADATKKAIEELNIQHTAFLERAYQKLYEGTPKEKQPANPQVYLEALKKEQKMKQIQFALTQLKNSLNQNEAALKKIKKETDAITVPNVIFEQAGAFTSEQWATHHHAKKRQLNETKAQLAIRRKAFYKSQTELETLRKKINAVGEQIASLTPATSAPSIQVKALSSLKENIQKQEKMLTEEYLEVKRTRIQKVELFIKKRQTLSAEKKQAQAFDEILVNVDRIRNQINAKIQVVNIRSHTSDYKNLAKRILEGTLKNPSCILKEDYFYEDMSQSIVTLEQQLKALPTKKIQKETPLSVLETAFNQALDAKIKDAQTKINTLQTDCEKKKQEWETFSNSNENLLLRHSREIANAPCDIREALTQCEDRFLDRIQLVDRKFQGVSIKNSRFRHAELIRCDFSGLALDRVDFSSADIQNCRFQNANFKGVILDDKTQLDWKNHAQQILLDNIANPYNGLASNYLLNLIKLVKTKCQGEVSGDWILNLLKKIGQVKQPDNLKEKEHLIAQQNRAVLIVTEFVPQLTLDEVLKLKALVENKHKGDENPYGFIRHELDSFRLKYGNTDPWEQIMICIKGQLNEITKSVDLTETQYKDGKKIMKTHVTHDYGFGFFYTPEIAHEWKVDHKPEEPKLNK